MAALDVTNPHDPRLPDQWPTMNMSRRLQGAVFVRMHAVYGWEPRRAFRDTRLSWASDVLGRPVESFKELDDDDVIILLRRIDDDERELAEPW